MSSPASSRFPLPWIAAVVIALVAGVFLARFLPFGPHPTASNAIHEGDHHDHGEHDVWTCGMHPQVAESGPGQCPICGMDLTPRRSAAPTTEGEREILYFRNPMDPTITSPVPAEDSMGMPYVPVYADQSDDPADGNVVRIDPAVVQNMNVRTAPIARRDLTRSLRTVGYLEFDQQRMVTVTTKYSGWVEKVFVNYVGEQVRRGQPLFEIYSPELVQTEQELLSALEFAREMEGAPSDARRRAESLVESARIRLGYWDVTPEQIARLEETGEVFRTLEVAAPAGGLVMKRVPGLDGMAVEPGMELFHIADLSSLWLSVELFEDQLAAVREGSPAEITLSYFPGETFRGRVRFLEPALSETTRTVRAMIEIPNRDGRLRKGMYATVELQPVEVRDTIAVPLPAVLRTGRRNVVVVAQGEGRFAPREVVLGREAEGFAEVLSGLEAGDQVVTSAQFLLDSESTLREAIQKMATAQSSSASAMASESAPEGLTMAPADPGESHSEHVHSPTPTGEDPVDNHAGHHHGPTDSLP
ncbi:MAG: efflux RND transporter periplasmic adaptor subunit [Acidobacteriota bacterium]